MTILGSEKLEESSTSKLAVSPFNSHQILNLFERQHLICYASMDFLVVVSQNVIHLMRLGATQLLRY